MVYGVYKNSMYIILVVLWLCSAVHKNRSRNRTDHSGIRCVRIELEVDVWCETEGYVMFMCEFLI